MIYLDHASTSLPRLATATRAATEAFESGNPGRGGARVASDAALVVEASREAVRSLVGWGTACFTGGATDALNIALRGWSPRPRVVAIDPLAHNAVVRTLAAMDIEPWTLPHDGAGVVDVDAMGSAWVDGTSLVVVTHASNVTGALQPVASIAAIARAKGAATLVDAAQTAGVVSLVDLPVDAIAFGAHKGLRALPGIGALVVRDGVVIEPTRTGGTGGESESSTMPRELPERLEAGSPNVVAIAAFGAAAREAHPSDVRANEMAMSLRNAVRRADCVVHGANNVPVVSFDIPGLPASEAADMLDRVSDIVVRAGLHCAPRAHRTLGTITRGTIRVSSGGTTTDNDLSELTAALRAITRAR